MKRAFAGIFMLSLAGCMQVGNTFDIKKVGELTPGVSTEQDAIAKLGKPIAVSAVPGGGRMLQWQYAFGTGIGVGGGAHAAILFDRNGVMAQVSHMSSTGAAPDIPQLQQNDPSRVRLGINGLESTDSKAPGMTVVTVSPGSAAEKAGIRPGDTITSYNGRRVRALADTLAVNEDLQPGASAPITVLRQGAAVDILVQF